MKKFTLLLVFFFFTAHLKAQVFEPPVIIEPANPVVGDVIRVGLFHTFYPPCLTLPADNFQGLSHLFEFNGNAIKLTAINDFFLIPICNPFPASPAPRAWYELGQLSVGAYTLNTVISDVTIPLPVPNDPNINPLVYGPTLIFEVTGIPPIAVASLSFTAQLVLAFLLLLLALLFMAGKVTLLRDNTGKKQ